jgi:hypothetical protein
VPGALELSANGFESAKPDIPLSTAVRDGLGKGLGPEQLPPGTREPDAVVAERARRNIGEHVERLMAYDRARIPDSYWSGVRRSLEKGFEVKWDVLGAGHADLVPGTANGLRTGLREVARWYRAYGRSGSPYNRDHQAPGREALDEAWLAGSPSDPDAAGMARRITETGIFQSRLIARVMIVQGEDGLVEAVDLAEGSGNAAYDRLALAQARAFNGSGLGPPTRGKRTLWAFETDFLMVPPMPLPVGCAFDAHFIPTWCFYPFKKRSAPAVRLEAIYQ